MLIKKRCGNSVELEYELRTVANNELIDLNLYAIQANLTDGIGGVVRMPLTVTKLTGVNQLGRCVVTVPKVETEKLFPSTYDINLDYIELSTGFSESVQTIYLQLDVQ